MSNRKSALMVLCLVLLGSLSGCLSQDPRSDVDLEILPVEEWAWAGQYADVQRVDNAFMSSHTRDSFGCPDEIRFEENSRAQLLGAHRGVWFLDLQWCGRDVTRASIWMDEVGQNGEEEDVFAREAARTNDLIEGTADELSDMQYSSSAEFEMAGFLMSLWVDDADRFDSLVLLWSEGSDEIGSRDASKVSRTFQTLARIQVGAERLEYLAEKLSGLNGEVVSCASVSEDMLVTELRVAHDRLDELLRRGIEDAPWLGGSHRGMESSIRAFEESKNHGWAPLAIRAAQESQFHYLTAVTIMDNKDWTAFPPLNFTSSERARGIAGLNEAVSTYASQWVREQLDFDAAILLNEAEAYNGEVLAHAEVLVNVATSFTIECG